MKYSKEEINKILGLKGANGELIDVFSLHGLLFIGNSKDGYWDTTITGRYCRFSEHSLFVNYKDFDWCKTEEDINDQFYECFREIVKERLV